MKSFRNSQQAEVFASRWWEQSGGRVVDRSRQQQGTMAGVSRDREGLDQAYNEGVLWGRTVGQGPGKDGN